MVSTTAVLIFSKEMVKVTVSCCRARSRRRTDSKEMVSAGTRPGTRDGSSGGEGEAGGGEGEAEGGTGEAEGGGAGRGGEGGGGDGKAEGGGGKGEAEGGNGAAARAAVEVRAGPSA